MIIIIQYLGKGGIKNYRGGFIERETEQEGETYEVKFYIFAVQNEQMK